MNDAFLSRLGLARKAGKLSPGFAAVKDSVTGGAAKLVIIAADISQKSEKEVRFICKTAVKAERVKFTTFEISNAIGTKAGIISINDEGFAKSILNNIPKE